MFDPLVAFQSYDIKQTGQFKYQSKCPGHEDRLASLTITETPEKILLHCHAGCLPETIVENIGYTLGDLFPENENIKQAYRENKKIEFKSKQFIKDYRIVTIVNSDIKSGKTVSEYDKQVAHEAYQRLQQFDDTDQLYQDLLREQNFNTKYNVWMKYHQHNHNQVVL